MKHRLFALAALLTLGATPAPDRIEFSIRAWGKPLSVWRIDATGAATRMHSEGPDFRTYRAVTRRFAAGPEGFARIRALLAPAERAASRDALPCEHRLTDLPYGTAAWNVRGKTSRISFDLGCRDKALAPIHQAFADADKQMEAWSAKGEIIDDREGRS